MIYALLISLAAMVFFCIRLAISQDVETERRRAIPAVIAMLVMFAIALQMPFF